jgi:precorrin isomerase
MLPASVAEATNMIEPVELVKALVWGGATGALMTLAAGIRRIPWRQAAVIGVGWGIVFAALKAATFGVDTSVLILVGAVGGSVAMHGFERGEQERKRISEAITSIRSAPPA